MGFSVTIFKDGAAGEAMSKVMERQSSPEGHWELTDKIPCWWLPCYVRALSLPLSLLGTAPVIVSPCLLQCPSVWSLEPKGFVILRHWSP